MLPNVERNFSTGDNGDFGGTFSSSSIRDFDFAGVVMGATLAGDGLPAAVATARRLRGSALPTSPHARFGLVVVFARDCSLTGLGVDSRRSVAVARARDSD